MKALLGLLRHPGRSLPPEHSLLLRASAAGAVGTGIVACLLQGLLQAWMAGPALAAVAAGGLWSYRRRARPVPYLRAALAGLMIGAFTWFFMTVAADAPAGALTAVEAALAALFAIMQAVHSFDLPTRRDLGFSIAGSATLIALASTQAVSIDFGLVVALWSTFVVLGLAAAWASMAGGAPVRAAAVVPAALAALAVAAVIVLVLPAPAPPAFAPASPASGTGGPGGSQPSHLVPASSSASLQTASATGPTGVGGYLGFAGPLNTALRASLGNEVVLRVRADRPSYWLAETYDAWSGQSWTQSARALHPATRAGTTNGGPVTSDGTRWETVTGGPPLVVGTSQPAEPAMPTRAAGPVGAGSGSTAGSAHPGAASDGSDGSAATPAGTGASAPSTDYQTFYLASSGSNLVLHASQAMLVWFPTHRLYVSADGTIESAQALGAGSVYTVVSSVQTPSPATLRGANGTQGLTAGVRTEDLRLPHPYPRVAALARRVTAGQSSVYGAVTALERWIGRHTTYTTSIPTLAAGQDAVAQFLFGSRRGYCEQISTSLAVMLRTLGIPAREAVGYVPGPYDPLTGTYDVLAKDAHAWVQVWFPGYGWQSFDPTAYVPNATPSSGSSLQGVVLSELSRIPLVPTMPLLGLLGLAAVLVRRHRRRPPTWRAAVTRSVERAARRSRVPTGPSDTLGTLAARVDVATGARGPVTAVAVAGAAERSAWEGWEPDPDTARRLVYGARRLPRLASRARARAILSRR